MNASWVSGAAWALVVGEGAVLLDSAPPPSALPALRAALATGDVRGATDAIGSPQSSGARGAVAVLGPQGVQFALWGDSTALAGVHGRAVLVQARAGGNGWDVVTVAGADGVVLGDPRADLARRLPVQQAQLRVTALQLGSAALAYSGPQTESEGVADAESMFSEMWGRTMRRPVEEAALRELVGQDAPAASAAREPAPVPAAPTVPASVDAEDAGEAPACPRYVVHDGQTLPPWKSQQLRASLAQVTVVASTGNRIPLDVSVVVGRAPSAEGAAGAVLVVPGSNAQVSRNHLRISREGGAVLVTDLGSANGSTIVRRGRAAESLAPHVPTPLGVDDVVELCEGITVRVERP